MAQCDPEWPQRAGRAWTPEKSEAAPDHICSGLGSTQQSKQQWALEVLGQRQGLTKCQWANRRSLPSRNPSVDSTSTELAEGPRRGPSELGPPPRLQC